jgi:hypothetical protein
MSKIKLISMREYIKRKMEIFKRITGKQLSDLIVAQKDEESSLPDSPEPRKDEDLYDDDEEDKKSVTDGRSYLVLDLRDPERFTACHVYVSHSHTYKPPPPMTHTHNTTQVRRSELSCANDSF